MKVKDIMTTKVELVQSSETISDASKKMKSLNVGVLPVKEGDKIVGIVTDRDIVMRVVSEGQDPKAATVKDAMSEKIVFCSCEADVQDACKMMMDRQIRRLMVTDTANIPIGIISIGDIAVRTQAEELAGETLEKISEAASPPR